MTTFLQVILDGLMSGMLYALVAVGAGDHLRRHGRY